MLICCELEDAEECVSLAKQVLELSRRLKFPDPYRVYLDTTPDRQVRILRIGSERSHYVGLRLDLPTRELCKVDPLNVEFERVLNLLDNHVALDGSVELVLRKGWRDTFRRALGISGARLVNVSDELWDVLCRVPTEADIQYSDTDSGASYRGIPVRLRGGDHWQGLRYSFVEVGVMDMGFCDD